MKRYLNIHVLIAHSPSCLNRDDVNAQKSAVIGGERRARISSQSLKRAIRTSEAYQARYPVSVRSALVLERLKTDLAKELKLEDKQVEAVLNAAKTVLEGGKADNEDKKKKKGKAADEGAAVKTQILAWGPGELEAVRVAVLGTAEDVHGKPEDRKEGGKKKKVPTAAELVKLVRQRLTQALRAVKPSLPLDIAMSGRMMTSAVLDSTEAALSIAHSVTTHAVTTPDMDWFTAVDDFSTDGAGHLAEQEFSAGVFYRYATINLDQLAENLGCDRAEAARVAADYVRFMATIVPGAMQNRFAAHNIADYVAVEISDQPLSYATAFEAPVKSQGEGYLKPSIETLERFVSRVRRGWSRDAALAVLDITEYGGQIPGVTYLDTIDDLVAWASTEDEREAA